MKILLFLMLLTASLIAQVSAVKLYMQGDSTQVFKIEDIENLTFSQSYQSYSLSLFQKGNLKTEIDVKKIDSILFEDNQILKIVLAGEAKTFNISSIDSIIFVSDSEPSDTNNFQIEVTTTSSPQNFIVKFVNPDTLHLDWGDGISNDYTITGNVTHTYAKAGVYIVKMSGFVNGIDFFIYPDPGTGTPELITAIKTPIRGITGLNTAVEMFKHGHNIPSIPPGLFDNCPEITSFYDTFLECKRIKSIPPGLFDKQTNVVNFYATFDNCDSLESIPPGLFDKHVNNTNFAWTFAKCYSLKSIPEGLFSKHTKVYTFSYVFFRCTTLTSLPALLFDQNTNVTDYSNAFYDCKNLVCESPTNSAGKKLWELIPVPKGGSCFRNCTKLTDYDKIPEGWK